MAGQRVPQSFTCWGPGEWLVRFAIDNVVHINEVEPKLHFPIHPLLVSVLVLADDKVYRAAAFASGGMPRLAKSYLHNLKRKPFVSVFTRAQGCCRTHE